MKPRLVHSNDQPTATVTRIPNNHQPAPQPQDPTQSLTIIGAVTIGPATATLILAIAFQIAGGISPIALATASWIIWAIALFAAAALHETPRS